MAIDEDIIPGPRIRACGHHLGTTGDMNNGGRWWKAYQTPGTDVCADGPDALRTLVRQEINRGAETIKIFASAGHGQPHRTTRNMSRDEIAAIIDAAHERGAKVRAHVADKAMIMECIELGLDVVDHGDEVDEEVIAAMAEAGHLLGAEPDLPAESARTRLCRAVRRDAGAIRPRPGHAAAGAGRGCPHPDRRRLQRGLPRCHGGRSAGPSGRQLWPRIRLLRPNRRSLSRQTC